MKVLVRRGNEIREVEIEWDETQIPPETILTTDHGVKLKFVRSGYADGFPYYREGGEA